MSARKTVQSLNRDLKAVQNAVEGAENGLSALGKRILAAKRKREEMLRGKHSAQINNTNMRRKHGGSRRGRSRKGGRTRRGRK